MPICNITVGVILHPGTIKNWLKLRIKNCLKYKIKNGKKKHFLLDRLLFATFAGRVNIDSRNEFNK
jgi:hypothetical protein